MNNQREFFRVDLYEIPIQIALYGVSEDGKKKAEKATVENISGNGVQIKTKYLKELSSYFHLAHRIEISFMISGQRFMFDCELVRESEEFIALRYIRAAESEKSRLSAALLRLDADRKRNNKGGNSGESE